GWRGVFFVNLPIAAVGWRLVSRGVTETERPETARRAAGARGLDWPAQAAGVLALVALTLAVIGSGRRGLGRTPPVPGAAAFAGLALAGAHTPYPYLAVPMAASGAGISVTMPAATAAVVEAAPTGRTGVASGALNAARQVGSALGIAVLGALLGAGA